VTLVALLALSSATMAGYVWGWTAATAPPPAAGREPVLGASVMEAEAFLVPKPHLRAQSEAATILQAHPAGSLKLPTPVLTPTVTCAD
jgi:hypothetical protein